MLLLRKVTQIKQNKEHSIYNVSRFVAPSLLLCQSTIGKSENDVTETIGNPDSSGVLHPMLPNADRYEPTHAFCGHKNKTH